MADFRSRLLAATLVTFLSLLQGVTSSPTPVAQGVPVSFCDPDSIDTYTPKWFLERIKPEFRNDPTIFANRLLFYTRYCTDAALDLSCKGFYITLWHLWPDSLYNKGNALPELQCIFSNTADTQIYYERMSAAFARLARGSATVMHAADDWQEPPMDGIFGRIETTNITAYTDIEELWAINDAVPTTRGDIFSLPSYHKDLRLAPQRMYATDLLLKEPRGSSEPGVQKRAAEGGSVCYTNRDWRHADTDHPLRALMDGETSPFSFRR